MGALLVLAGTLLLMMSSIWIIGEALKKDVATGVCALLLFPFYSFYYTFWCDYARGQVPFFVGIAGAVLIGAGFAVGI